MFVLVEGGSHHSANTIGQAQYRAALGQLFHIKEKSSVDVAGNEP
jgi:hypothetical protein